MQLCSDCFILNLFCLSVCCSAIAHLSDTGNVGAKSAHVKGRDGTESRALPLAGHVWGRWRAAALSHIYFHRKIFSFFTVFAQRRQRGTIRPLPSEAEHKEILGNSVVKFGTWFQASQSITTATATYYIQFNEVLN